MIKSSVACLNKFIFGFLNSYFSNVHQKLLTQINKKYCLWFNYYTNIVRHLLQNNALDVIDFTCGYYPIARAQIKCTHRRTERLGETQNNIQFKLV